MTEGLFKFFKKKKIKKFTIVDDKINEFKINYKILSNKIRETDFIIMSPGVSILNSKINKYFNKNKKKIIRFRPILNILSKK